MSLPLGQPPVSGLSPQLRGGAWSTAFHSRVCPRRGSRSCTGGHGHSEVRGLTPTARCPRGATKKLLLLWKQRQLGRLGPPHPRRGNKLWPGASGPLPPWSGHSWAAPWLWALPKIPGHLNEGLPCLQALWGTLSFESTLRVHCGVRGRRGCWGGSGEGAARPGGRARVYMAGRPAAQPPWPRPQLFRPLEGRPPGRRGSVPAY